MTPHRPHLAPRLRRGLLALGGLGVALALSACDDAELRGSGADDPGEGRVQVVVASTVLAGGSQQQLAALRAGLDDLRAETGTGWRGRQDDVTGFLTELSGGSYAGPDPSADGPAVARSLLEEHGPALFGIGPGSLLLGEESAPTVAGVSTVRAQQVVGAVPVLDAGLVVTLTQVDGAPRVTAVRGRVFPDLTTSTRPAIPARLAARTARRAAGGGGATTSTRPELVVLPTDGGRLAWQVRVTGGRSETSLDGLWFVDALTGDVLQAQPGSIEGLVARPVATSADGDAVEVGGTSDVEGAVRGIGQQRGDQVVLVDTTVPTYDPATGDGAIITYDANGTEALPGTLATSPGAQFRDGEAVAAHAFSRAVYDYYASLGRRSWDDQGSSLVSSVDFGDPDFCNAQFNDSGPVPQMVYGAPCDGWHLVTADTAGHEITHGVISSSADLVYSGQSGALNEGFADYFGNIIGDLYEGTDSSAYGEQGCVLLRAAQSGCSLQPDGSLATRNLLNDNTFGDYFYALNLGFRFNLLARDNNDHGGVHHNSSILVNALWGIRSRLAQIEGTTMIESGLATDFDKIVYAAMTTQLSPGSGFLDARNAIEQTITAAGADPVVLRVAREIFDLNLLCEGCTTPESVPGDVVVSSPQTQLAPTVSGDQVAWVDLSTDDSIGGLAATADASGSTPTGFDPGTGSSLQVGFAGEALVSFDIEGYALPGEVARYEPDGTRTVVGAFGNSSILAGLAGSDSGAAWLQSEVGSAFFVDPAGAVSELDLAPLGGDTVTALGVGDGLVAMGTDAGRVLLWDPATGEASEVGSLRGAVFAVATASGRVLALDDGQAAVLLDGAGGKTELSDAAIPHGAALTDDYAVWPTAVAELTGRVVENGTRRGTPDTDLYLYSLATGQIYRLLEERGQQGFPAVSGDRLVWQDAVFGGDDILTATLPPGL